METIPDISTTDYGDGSLLYNGNEVGINGPVSSIRLEVIRDGIEDFDYLKLVEELLGTAACKAYINRLVTSLTSYANDPWQLEACRIDMGNAIESAYDVRSIFSDGFESNNLVTGIWTYDGCHTQGNSVFSGSYAVALNGSGYLIKPVSTVSYANIQVQYARSASQCVANDDFFAEWYDGTTWQTLEDVAGNSPWTLTTLSLPPAAGNNAGFMLRFRTSYNGTTDFAYLDQVSVTGDPTYSVSGQVVLNDYTGDVTKVPVQIELRQHGGPTTTITVNLDASGHFVVGGVVASTYDVAIKASHWLQKVVTNVVVGP